MSCAGATANLRDDCPRVQPPLLEQEKVIAPEVSRGDAIETRACVLAERVHDLDVTADGRRGIVATDQIVAMSLAVNAY
jgi:hypothetical protein